MSATLPTVTTASVVLNTGARLPQVGLGVWQSPRGSGTRSAVETALRLGYRHVDTARIYGNEADVGAAVRASGLPREEVFVTTKLWNADQGHDSALRAFNGFAVYAYSSIFDSANDSIATQDDATRFQRQQRRLKILPVLQDLARNGGA